MAAIDVSHAANRGDSSSAERRGRSGGNPPAGGHGNNDLACPRDQGRSLPRMGTEPEAANADLEPTGQGHGGGIDGRDPDDDRRPGDPAITQPRCGFHLSSRVCAPFPFRVAGRG